MTLEPDLSLRYLLAELARIDMRLQAAVRRWQQAGQDATDGFRGLYVSDVEVDSLLARPVGGNWGQSAPLEAAEAARFVAAESAAGTRAQALVAAAEQRGEPIRLQLLAQAFDLDAFDLDALLICLAPELDLRYERVYGYLQDDVTRRRPSVDLVLALLAPTLESRLQLRERFAPSAPLIRHDLLYLFQDPSHPEPPLLGKHLKVDDRIIDYLLGVDRLDARLAPYTAHAVPDAHLAELLLPDDVKQRLLSLAEAARREDAPLILYFQGPAGTGKRTTAEALCRELGLSLVAVDARRLAASEDLPFARGIRLALREARLAGLASPAGAPQSAALYWDGFDVLLDEAHAEPRRALIEALEGRGPARAPRLTFLAGAAPWEPTGALYDARFVRVEFAPPAYTERLRLWSTFLADAPLNALLDADLPALAGTFRFTAGQTRDAAATARNLALWRDSGEGGITREDLYAASRLHSNPGLSALAQKLRPRYAWEDITLPADRLQLLREICNQLKHRAQVYETWGFGGKLSLGKGLNVMFAGPSGTGKTMAAEILAHELGLDLYKIDLSSVVSKYIGETEKNLARIFAEAETSNAILFFDEADALFGKRSEVRDSHDRYANIEISYLLQRMEEYDGMAILASNLHKNMDEAFVRRMHFTVEFPFPEEAHRLRIWQKIWPAATPRSADLDLPFMARHFEITGGNIRNIAVAAAFLAADDGQVVSMAHLLAATQREYQKMGKVLVDGAGAAGLQLQRS